MIKYPGKSNVREERFILARSSRMQSIMEGKSRQREAKAAGYIIFTIKNKPWLLIPLTFSSVYSPGPLPRDCTSHNGRVVPYQLKTRKSLKGKPKGSPDMDSP